MNWTHRFYSLIVALVLVFPVAVSAEREEPEESKFKDIIYTRDGDEYFGELIKVDDDRIFFRHADGRRDTFAISDLKSVDLGKRRPGDQWRTVEDIDDPLLKEILGSAPSAQNYPMAGHIVLYEIMIITLHQDSSSDVTNRQIIKIFKESGKREATQSFSYYSDNQECSIDFARSISPEGEVASLSDNAVEDAFAFIRYPRYQRLKQKKFALKEAREGSVLDYQITIHTAKHDVFNPLQKTWYFQSDVPILRSEVVVRAPQGIEIAYNIFNMGDIVQKSREGDMTEYRWVVTDSEPFIYENNMPPGDLVFPVLYLTTVDTWDNIAAAFRTKTDEAFANNTKTQEKTEELLAHGPENEIETLYNFVAEEIKLIGVGFMGYHPYPGSPDEVLEHNSGSSLDKSFLLWSMLKLRNYDPVLVLAMEKEGRGNWNPDEPSCLGAFGKLLVKVKDRETIRYLDPGSEFYRFDKSNSYWWGVKSLEIGDGSPFLVKTSVRPISEELWANYLEGSLHPDGSLTVEGYVEVRGGNKEHSFRTLKNKEQQEIDDYFENFVKRYHQNARLLQYKLDGYKALKEQLEKVFVSFEIEDFAITAGEKFIIFRPPGVGYGAGEVGIPQRKYPMYWAGPSHTKNRISVRFPEGYSVYYVTQGEDLSTRGVTFDSGLVTEQDRIIYEDEYIRELEWLNVEDYAGFKQLIEQRSLHSKEWIVLKKI